jgi:hypothetical protein
VVVVAALLAAAAPFTIQAEIHAFRPCFVASGAQFDRGVWDTTIPCNGREAMVGDLEQNHLTIGMTRQEVVDLLGQPDSDDEFYSGDHTITYVMNQWLNGDWLEIDFDAGWRLTASFVHQED